MDKNDIINYVMEIPENTNPAILGEMLDSYGGSGEVFWVTYTYDEDASSQAGRDIYICDHTFQEIKEAFDNNKNVIARRDQGEGYLIIPLTSVTNDDLEYCLVRADSLDTHFDLDYEYIEHQIEDGIEDISVMMDNISIPKQ